MKIMLSSRKLFMLGFVILVATNILVFTGIILNRSGDPDSIITLTERELQMPYRFHTENSGLALKLDWRALGKYEEDRYYIGWRSPAWLTAVKFKELGFKKGDLISLKEDVNTGGKPVQKEVFIVLENNGDPYTRAVKRAQMVLEKEERSYGFDKDNKTLKKNFERAQTRLKQEQATRSRLFAIDAGIDLNTLKETYGDRTRYIIAKGLVKPRYHYKKKNREVYGYISKLSIENIHVPLKQRKILDTIIARKKAEQKKLKQDKLRPPRYEIELAYGSRLEPWIVSVRPLNENDTAD